MVIRNAFTVLLASVAVIGCTGKSSKRTVHSGPLTTNEDTGTLTAAEAKNEVQALYAQRASLSERVNNVKTAAQALAIALELEKTVLNSAVLEDANQAGISEFDSVLSQFHRALDKALDLDQALVIKSGILARYETAALANCTTEGKGCSHLAAFRGDHLSSRILMRIASTLETSLVDARKARLSATEAGFAAAQTAYFTIVQRYYRLLNLSYEMSNAQSTPELDQRYVNFARDYFDYFRQLPADLKQPELHRKFRDTMTLALGHLRNQSQGQAGLNERYCQFLTELNPLNPDMFSTMDLDKRSQRSMLSEFMECTSRKGQLAGMIQQYVRAQNITLGQTLALDKKKFEEDRKKFTEGKLDQSPRYSVKAAGYAYSSAELAEVPFLYNNLAIKLTPRDDMAFFILDRVFYQQMDQNTAQNYWSRVKGLNELDFLKFARNYARIQTAYVLKVTMQNYGLIMKEQFANKGGLNSEFFYEVVKEVNGVSQFDWDELRDGLSMMREFMIKNYDSRLLRAVTKEDKLLQAEYLALKEELGGALADHLAMAVTTPLTVPLYYYMAKAQGTIKFHVSWAKDPWFDVPAADALAQFLTPGTTGSFPFFKIGTMDQSWNELQKLHILDYALRIGIFEFIDFSMLEEDKQLGEPAEVMYFKQASKDILKNFEYSFTSAIERLDTLAASANFTEQFLGTCEDPINASVNLEFKDLQFATLLNNPTINESVNSIYGNVNFIPAWRMYRDSLNEMVKVMENHFNVAARGGGLTAAKQAKTQEILAKTRAEIGRFDAMERRYFSQMLAFDKQVVNRQRNCLERMHRAENFRRNQLMAANIDFFKNVHAAMNVLNLVEGANVQTIDDAFNAYHAAIAKPGASAWVSMDVRNRALGLLTKISQAGLMSRMDLKQALNETLQIHNNDQSPYDKLGIFVTGLPTLKQSGVQVKTQNSFDRQFFNQGGWDTLVRNRRFMETLRVNGTDVNRAVGTNYQGPLALAPNVRIPLGTFGELENNPLYTSNATKPVTYSPDQYKFVKAAMIQFAGAESGGSQFVSWFSDGGLSVALPEKRLAWLKDVQELGVIELADSDVTACPKDKAGRVVAVRDVEGNALPGAPKRDACAAIQVSASDVMDAYLTVMNLMRVSDNERALLDIMDRPGKLEKRIKAYLTYNAEPSTSKWTYFDQFYRTNYTSIQVMMRDGRDWKRIIVEDIRGRNEFQAFKAFYQQFIEGAPALFPLRTGPTQIKRDSIRSKSLLHLSDITQFEESVYDLEERRVDLGSFLIEKTTAPRNDEPLIFGNWRVMAVKKRGTGERAGTPVYLNEENSAKSWFAGFVESFVVKDTDCDFLPQAGDPDFIKETPGDCRARFNAWKAEREAGRLLIRQSLKQAGGN